MAAGQPEPSIDPDAALTASPRSRYRQIAIAALGAGLLAAAVTAYFWPHLRGVVGYFLFAIPAHLLISFLANEPALFAAAKAATPASVALAGTAGCLVAIALDYALIGWFVNHRLVKTELDDSRAFRVAQRFFGRAPFALIVISALLPLPFYPVKILAIARDYSLARFALAVVLGRLPRFYMLAIAGREVQASSSALVSAGVALALIGGWGIWRTIRRNRRKRSGTIGNDRERS